MKFRLIIDKSREEEVTATVHARSELTDCLEQLVLQHSGADRIMVYTEDDVRILSFSEIECIMVQDGKTYAIDVAANRYLLKQRLYEVEEILPSAFIRINKSAIANENRLLRFSVSHHGAVDAEFRCGYREYVSRRCFAEIKRRFDTR